MGRAEIEFDSDFSEEKLKEIFSFDPVSVAESVADEMLLQEGCPFDSEVNLFITDSGRIQEANRENRGIDAVTDVLSFPVCEYMTPGDFKEAEADPAGCFNPENGRLMLGDILINADRVLSQAEEYGHSVKREFAFLTAHSLLHLAGYDHMTPEEEEIMQIKQESILNKLNIKREDCT